MLPSGRDDRGGKPPIFSGNGCIDRQGLERRLDCRQLAVVGYIAMPCRPVSTQGPAMKVVFDSGVSRTAGQSHPLGRF
jgi:hypothetical protein